MELLAAFNLNVYISIIYDFILQANHDLSLAIASMMVAHHGSSLKVLTKSLDWLLTSKLLSLFYLNFKSFIYFKH